MKKGKVWLVGAGPSDFELLTIKAKKVIKTADIIVYDRLVSFNILSLRKDSAILVDVGKRKDNHTLPQEEINALLMKYAKDNKKVVRLKGGDPFLFGRGGEELEFLIKNGVDCELVCGISSALSVPAYAGIPITHRNFSSSIHIVTGHKKNDTDSSINYNALKDTGGTLVFLMGISRLNDICTGLLSANMDKATPVCIIEQGTTSKQRTICAALDTICSVAIKEKVKTPAIIIVGKVCALRNTIDWRKNLYLNGMRIIATRPKNKSSLLCHKLRDYGAEVIEMPSIKIKELENDNILNTFNNITKYKYLIFTSTNSVNIFFNKITKYKIDIRYFYGIKFVAIGEATKNAIEGRGILVDIMPNIYNGENLAKKLLKIINKNDNILIFSPKIYEKSLENILEDKNINFDKCTLYETVYKDIDFINFEFLYTDIVTFTSTSTVKSFVKYMSDKDICLENVIAVCIGETTQNEAKKYNMRTYVSDIASIDSVIEKIKELAKEIKDDK